MDVISRPYDFTKKTRFMRKRTNFLHITNLLSLLLFLNIFSEKMNHIFTLQMRLI